MPKIEGKQTQYGFEWGAANIERCFCDEKKGWVTMFLKTKRYPHGIQIYVTKTGQVRFLSHDGEWKKEKKICKPSE
jgi:hypothetical protein